MIKLSKLKKLTFHRSRFLNCGTQNFGLENCGTALVSVQVLRSISGIYPLDGTAAPLLVIVQLFYEGQIAFSVENHWSRLF